MSNFFEKILRLGVPQALEVGYFFKFCHLPVRQRRCFFRHQRKAVPTLFFESKKRQRFRALVSANNLLLLLINSFQDFFSIYIFTCYSLESLLSAFFFTLVLLPRYFCLVEQAMQPL